MDNENLCRVTREEAVCKSPMPSESVTYNVAQSKAHNTHTVHPVVHCSTSQCFVVDTQAPGSYVRRLQFTTQRRI